MEITTDINNKIKGGWIAGLISGTLTLIVTLFAVNSGSGFVGQFSWLNLIDVVLIFGLTYGIYRKSRVAATLMFIYFLISKLLAFSQVGFSSSLFIALLFLYVYFKAMIGTFEYHNMQKKMAEPVPSNAL